MRWTTEEVGGGMMERCWYNKFYGEQCTRPGVYATKETDSKFVHATKWCVEHRHANDVLIEPVILEPEAREHE